MNTFTRHLILGVAALAVAGSALAGTQSPASTSSSSHAKQSSKMSGSSATPTAKPAATTTLAASGKIVSFDATSQSLTLSTSKGEERFTLDRSTRLQESSHAIAPADLAKLTGHQATVRYRDASGQKSVVSVRVSSAAAKAQTKH
jgi:hypothetical protein